MAYQVCKISGFINFKKYILQLYLQDKSHKMKNSSLDCIGFKYLTKVIDFGHIKVGRLTNAPIFNKTLGCLTNSIGVRGMAKGGPTYISEESIIREWVKRPEKCATRK